MASSLVKQIAAMGGDISAFVPDQAAAAIARAIAERA
jgi:phosphopantetheine adenylyltransferase